MARDIGEWLEQLGLGEYAEAFAKNRIKFDHLAGLSEADLRELGVAATRLVDSGLAGLSCGRP